MTADELAASLRLLGFNVSEQLYGRNTINDESCLYTFSNENVIVGYIYEDKVMDLAMLLQTTTEPDLLPIQDYYDKTIKELIDPETREL